ncbi:MAG: hypothetical protein M3Z27_00365 [Actinomycetota bacterium]|nr:hypothetical protein [Actinomycetota bacterium]
MTRPTTCPRSWGGGERRGQRHEDLGDDRQHADRDERAGEHDEAGRRRTYGQGSTGADEHGRDQSPALAQIAERDQQRQSDDIAHLRAGHQQPRRGVRDPEGAGDQVEQRLDVVDVGHRRADRDRQHQDQRA